MSRRAGIVAAAIAAVVVALVIAVELAAVPLAQRALDAELGRCLDYDEVAITSVGRPLTPGLVVGRVRDVEVDVTGAQVRGLRVDRARVSLPLAVAPWAPLPPDPPPAVVEATVTDEDVTDYLAAQDPLGVDVEVRFDEGQVGIGVGFVELVAGLRVDDGVVTLTPGGLPPEWWTTLGLDLEFALPEDLQVAQVALRPGEATARLRIEVVAGIDGSSGCRGPLTGDVG